MKLLSWILGGTIGGAIGAAIWTAVSYFGNVEIGWIAWGVGFLTGLGVLIATKGENGTSSGVVAAILAVLAVAGGKYLVAHFLVEKAMTSASASVQPIKDEDFIQRVAFDVVEEYEAAKKKMIWPAPAGKKPDEINGPQDFPKAVWTEAKKRWDAKSPQDQTEIRKQAQAENEAFVQFAKAAVRNQAFQQSFSPMDLLFFGLAVVTAFKMGSGLASSS